MAGWGVYARYIYSVLCFYLPMDYDIVLMPNKNINKGLSISIFHSIPVLSSVAVQFSSVTFYLELQGLCIQDAQCVQEKGSEQAMVHSEPKLLQNTYSAQPST